MIITNTPLRVVKFEDVETDNAMLLQNAIRNINGHSEVVLKTDDNGVAEGFTIIGFVPAGNSLRYLLDCTLEYIINEEYLIWTEVLV